MDRKIFDTRPAKPETADYTTLYKTIRYDTILYHTILSYTIVLNPTDLMLFATCCFVHMKGHFDIPK